MSTTVKTGWLKDSNGDKFAPKTLTSQIQTSDGTLLEDKLQADLETMKNENKNYIETNFQNIINDSLENAKNSGEFDGQTGVGIESVVQTKASNVSDGENELTITLTNGEEYKFVVKNGSKGQDGKSITDAYLTADYKLKIVFSDGTSSLSVNSLRGEDGASVTVSSVNASTEDGGSNVVTFSDGKTLSIKNGNKGNDGYTPQKNVDYYTEADKVEWSEYIASELAKRGQLQPEFAESKEWLDENGDTSKMYVLPDGYIWAHMMTEKEVESGIAYTNKLPQATDTDRTSIYGEDYNGDGVNDGYLKGTRLSSSGTNSTLANACVSGFISVKEGDVVRIKGATPIQASSDCYIITYDSANTKIAHKQLPKASGNTDWSTNANTNATYSGYFNYTDGIITITLNSNFGTGFNAIRFSAGTIDENTIVTVNEEIKEGGGTTIVTEYAWANTGHAFVSADYNNRITNIETKTENLETLTTEHSEAIKTLQESIANNTTENTYETVNSIEECTDTSNMYLLPDGYIYAYRAMSSRLESLFTNLLHTAIDTDGTPYNNGFGYKEGYRLNSNGVETEESGCCITGYIPVEGALGQTLRFKNMPQSSQGEYIQYFREDFTKGGSITYESEMYANVDENGVYTVTLKENNYTKYLRLTAGQMSADTIITIDEEIAYQEVDAGYEWVNTGLTPETATVDNRLLTLEGEAAKLQADLVEVEQRLADVESGITNLTDSEKLALIRDWDAPIYDRTPVWEMTNEKTAITSAEKTVDAVYAKYDALMAENTDFITKTDLGLCSDGVTHVYRYDFCEREPRHQSGFEWSETKPKFIVVTGIHREWNGIYGMYNALAEIATNSDLAELRRSVHFIVVPVLNPYSISGPYATVGHAANANGVEIHRNFEVGFAVSGEGTIHYTGETALSEVESQYLDAILSENSDAAYFLTCHSFDRDKTWGVGFLWGSSATKYMCNMCFRVIDKMGKAWHKKYGTTWENGIKNANSGYTALDEGDYRIGHAALTNTGGSEQRQATKYGIQATNFEVGETFFVLDETSLSAKAITHGAEAYINFFLTAMGCYDRKDRKDYAPN